MAPVAGVTEGGGAAPPASELAARSEQQDAFAVKAGVYISQQAHEEGVRALLSELLALRGPEAVGARAAADFAARAVAASPAGGSVGAAALAAALDLHGLEQAEAWWKPDAWLEVRRPLLECVLNAALGLGETLTEPRVEILRRVAARRSRDRLRQRFGRPDCAPLSDPDEEWRAQLDDWRRLLAPYPWSRVRAKTMGQALAAADLRGPLAQREQLVQAYEVLRCLGGGLVDAAAAATAGAAANAKAGDAAATAASAAETLLLRAAEALEAHGSRYGCWRPGELTAETLAAHATAAVATAAGVARPVRAEEEAFFRKAPAAVAQLGFRPSAVQGARLPAAALCHLTRRLLALVAADLLRAAPAASAPAALRARDGLLAAAEALLEREPDGGAEGAGATERLRSFLLGAATAYARGAGECADGAAQRARAIDFAALAAQNPQFELLRDLEAQAEETQSFVEEMAMEELVQLLQRIQLAFVVAHGPGQPVPPELWAWAIQADDIAGGLDIWSPEDIDELGAALQAFLRRNRQAARAGDGSPLALCVVQALLAVAAGPDGSEAPAAAPRAGAGFSSLAALPPLPDAPHDAAACRGAAVTADEPAGRVVACFGAAEAAGGASAGDAPVVVRAVPLCLGAEAEASGYEVREVGLRLGGMYQRLTNGAAAAASACLGSSAGGAADGGAVVVHYAWAPPGEEDSMPLHLILASATHVRLVIKESGAVESRDVDLRTNRVWSDSSRYRALPSRPVASADAHGGFRRYVVEVGPGLRPALPSGLLQAPPGEGVVESADVIADTLALWFSRRRSKDDIAEVLRLRPALLYFASTALFERLDSLAPTLLEASRDHWARVLSSDDEVGGSLDAMPVYGLGGPGQREALVVRSEAQAMLLALLTARPSGRLCAALPPSHLAELCALLQRTRHSAEFLAIERSCFESALERIVSFQDSAITFIIIDVTGQISALQLAELVRNAHGSVRLVFSCFRGLLASLAATEALSSVAVPPSVEADLSTRVAPTLYRDSFALGQATLRCSRLLAARPDELSPLAGLALRPGGLTPPERGVAAVAGEAGDSRPAARWLDWHRNLLEAQHELREAHAWREREAAWRAGGAAAAGDETLLLLVTADDAPVRGHYEALPESEGVRCFSLHHSDRHAYSQIEALLDRAAAARRASGDAQPPRRLTVAIFGVGNAAPAKLADLVARARLAEQRIAVVVREPVGALRSVRVATRRSTEYVQARIVWVRALPQADPASDAVASAAASDVGRLGLRALILVLGAAALPSERHTAALAALRAGDAAACAALLPAGLRPELAADLAAGVLQTLGIVAPDASTDAAAGACDGRSLAYALGCLAAGFAQRASALGLAEDAWDVSFPDFRAFVPVCRFLDQISVAEAWCRYLNMVGASGALPDERKAPAAAGAAAKASARWTRPGAAPHRHFLLSQWVLESNAHCAGIEDLLEHAVPIEGGAAAGPPEAPPAMYHGTGEAHVSEAQEEVLERHMLQRGELGWAHFSEAWRTALDIKPEAFLKLAAFGVDTLRLFLCLPPERAIELGIAHLLDPTGSIASPQAKLSTVVARKLLRDVECNAALLEAAIREGAAEVAPRLAAVKWLLLTALPESDAAAMLSGVGRIDEETVRQLVHSKVVLCPRGRDELLRRVVAVMLGLDGGDVLGTQHEVRRFLLDTELPLTALLPDRRAQVGRAVVSFLFSPDHAGQLKSGEAGRAVVESFVALFGFDVLHWRPAEGVAAEASEPHRFTAAAHAAVLERAPGPEVARMLAAGPLVGAIFHLAALEGPRRADDFLSGILDRLPPGSDGLVLAVLETLAEQDTPASAIMASLEERLGRPILQSCTNPFLPALFSALRAQSLGHYLALVAAHEDGDPGRPVQLALDRSPPLQILYIQHFRKLGGGADEACSSPRIHQKLLDDASCAALFQRLAAQAVQGEQAADLSLLWACWGRSPDRQLPFWALPRSHGVAFTSSVCGGGTVPFVDRCRSIGAGLTLFAKYLVAPETLPLGVYNTFAHQVPWAHSEKTSSIDVQTLLLGQEDHEEYPPYCLRWHGRALPSALRGRLLRRCAGDVGPLGDPGAHHFYPRVASGVGEESFRFNLGLLLTLTPDNPALNEYFGHGSSSQRQFLAACILCWFKAAGFQFKDLQECVAVVLRQGFAELWAELHEGFRKTGPTSLRGMYVRGPLPNNIDVRWVEERAADVPIFARTRDSALLTAQWLNMLILHFELDNIEPFTPEDLVCTTPPPARTGAAGVAGAAGAGGLSPGPRLHCALETVAGAVGAALRRNLAADGGPQALVAPLSEEGKYDTQRLVTKLAVLTDFVALLRTSLGSVGRCCAALVVELGAATDDGPAPSDAHLAALFDTFFLLQGQSSEDEVHQIEELARAYHANGLPLSRQTLEEVRWLHENYWGRKDRNNRNLVVSRFPHLSAAAAVCDSLARIRALPLKTVEFRRHFENTIFVGHFLGEDEAPPAPPYLKQLHFQLACERGARTGMLGRDRGAAAAAPRDAGDGAGADFGFCLGGGEDFFTATCDDALGGSAPAHAASRGGGGGGACSAASQQQWGRPDDAAAPAWGEVCPVIKCAGLVEIDARPSSYLHAAVRVKPGVQAFLWQTDKEGGFYRLSSLTGDLGRPRRAARRGEQLRRAFATTADAWQFIDRAAGALVALDGCYLRKADDGSSWIVVFPSARSPDEEPAEIGGVLIRPRRRQLWPFCHSHKLVDLSIHPDTLEVLNLMVRVAWECSRGDGGQARADEADPSSGGIADTLRNLSALSNYVERAAADPSGAEDAGRVAAAAQRLERYQRFERLMAEALLRMLRKLQTQHRDDLGELLLVEAQRCRATFRMPFAAPGHADGEGDLGGADGGGSGLQLTELGCALERLLVLVVARAGVAGVPSTTKARTQLELALEACCGHRGSGDGRERCLAKHVHVTKASFMARGAETLRRIYAAEVEVRRIPPTRPLSESEDDGTGKTAGKTRDRAAPAPSPPRRIARSVEARSHRAYVDAASDRAASGGGAPLLGGRDAGGPGGGYGRPLRSRCGVLTFFDEDLPLYFVQLNRERLKIQYSASEGLCLGYLVHKDVFAELLENAWGSGQDGPQVAGALRRRLLHWLADLLRSPLPSETKTWILRCCERMGMIAVAPYQEARHVNLAVIAFCLCRCFPSGTSAALFLRSVLTKTWYMPAEVRAFVERKSDVYGLYIVKHGTLQRMLELGLQVAVRSFEREAWQGSLNSSAMYLDIVAQFSDYCCFVYVQGLMKVDDILLKWLAEYTRLHPWRFVFLEGVDTSFNFPENRDRCNFRQAPPNPLHGVSTLEDLHSPLVEGVRPIHTVSYPETFQPSVEDLADPRRLASFFEARLRSDGVEGDRSLFENGAAASNFCTDFRGELERYLFGDSPCLVLLVSAPGAGKTHHMGLLRGSLESERHFDIHEFDGSSDLLVTTALAEVLQNTMSTQSKKLLILDEYHMLSDEHKDELFQWVRARLGPSLRVVLIANRIDSKDRERMEQSRPAAAVSGSAAGAAPSAGEAQVVLIQTRLSMQRTADVMETRGNAQAWRGAICDWLVASRLLFGEESVSLRLCDTLEGALERPCPRQTLVELLVNRIPTISHSTAAEFVSAYLQHIGGRGTDAPSAPGLVSLCFRLAMLDRRHDELCSFVEFLERTPRAQEAPPSVRLLAWCAYVMRARDYWDVDVAAHWAKRRMVVDQVNFPFELAEDGVRFAATSGPTFSWAGDPTSLRDLVDAVKRGHSVDWADVHRKVWSRAHIKDSDLFAQLLSSSRNPGIILQQVLPGNLCGLLRLSNTPPATAVQLGRIILKHAPHVGEGAVDRPRCLALWTILLHDRQPLRPADFLALAGGVGALLEALLWARDWGTERHTTAAPGPRARVLQQLLVLVCMQDQVPVPLPQAATLWTGSFGRLLHAGTSAQEDTWAQRFAELAGGVVTAELLVKGDIPTALPLARLRRVLARISDVQEDWPNEVRALWRIGHCRSTSREISALWSAAPHLLQDVAASGLPTSRPVHEYFLPGIVAAPGVLCRSLQRALLCNRCQVPESVAPAAYVAACADAVNELRNADQLSTARIGGAAGQAIQRLLAEDAAG